MTSSTSIPSNFSRVCGDYLLLTRNIATSHAQLNAQQLQQSKEARQNAMRELLHTGETLWNAVIDAQLFSRNEELEEYATTALELLWLPFLLSDVYQQFQGDVNAKTTTTTTTGAGAVGSSSSIDGTGGGSNRLHASGAGPSTQQLSTAEVVQVSQHRRVNLSRSKAWAILYLNRMEDVGLVSEKEKERYLGSCDNDPDAPPSGSTAGLSAGAARQRRVELSQLRRQRESEWRALEEKISFTVAKQQRWRRLLTDSAAGANDNGDEGEAEELQDETEANSELSEVRRDRAMARLRFGIYETFYQLEMSERELEMLQRLDPDARVRIAEAYQEALEATRRGERSRGRHTYTVLPNGEMMAGTLANPQPLQPAVVQRGGGGGGGALPYGVHTKHNLGVLPSTAQYAAGGGVYAQQVRDDLMRDRNPPTQTLREFADGEIRQMLSQQDQEREAKRVQQEEAERLGEEGVEERDRVKAAKWDDWKDDNPRYGKTSKGNYS